MDVYTNIIIIIRVNQFSKLNYQPERKISNQKLEFGTKKKCLNSKISLKFSLFVCLFFVVVYCHSFIHCSAAVAKETETSTTTTTEKKSVSISLFVTTTMEIEITWMMTMMMKKKCTTR